MRWLIVILGLLLAVPAAAQTPVTGGDGLAWAPSPDHDATVTLQDGTNADAVSQYQVDIAPASNPGLMITRTYPKSSLVVSGGEILLRPFAPFGELSIGVPYVAYVSAVGPGGSSRSTASDPFVRSIPPPLAPRSPGKPRAVVGN